MNPDDEAEAMEADAPAEENGAAGEEEAPEEKVYMPGDPIPDDEELTFDKSAYHMYHVAQTGAPCLSFDIVPDSLGQCRTEFPMTCYMTCGTQADIATANSLIAMKMSNLTRTEADGSDSDNSYIDDEENKDGPRLQTVSIKHVGGVNRIRQCAIGDKKLVATWSDTGKVHIWDITTALDCLDQPGVPDHQKLEQSAMFSFAGHQAEGFALDWSGTTPGRLATGSCNRNIHLWQPREGGWDVDQRPMNSHEDSVEDIQWSPNEANVFASCSADQTIRIWDARGVGAKACMITCKAHEADVNVISWNRNDPFIVSGGDDGIVKVWDLRKIQQGAPVAAFKHHTKPITSVEWHPTDNTVFAASGADDQVTIWDLAVEKDDTDMQESAVPESNAQLPPQLLFIHMGQTNIKELHWHRQLPGVLASTSESGFNVFKTISV